MERFKNILIAVLTSFLLISAGAWQIYKAMYQKQKAETERVTKNYDVLKGSFEIIKGRDSINSARVEAQELTISELKSYYGNIVQDLQDMKISLKKIAGITVFNTETTNNIHTSFRDSTVRDTIPIQYIDYHSKWFDLNIVKQGNDALIKNVTRDSLIQVIHWNYKGKFWLTRFLTEKEYHQDIKSANPDSKILYAQWIRIYHKRKLRKESNQYQP